LSGNQSEKFCDDVEAKTHNRPLGIQADIRDIKALQTAIACVRDRFSAIDILINNAARDTRHDVENWSTDDWDDSIATNLRPLFFAVQSVVGDMEAAGRGAIINVGSNSFNLGLAGFSNYVTAKGGIVGMTRALARELGPAGIRVNTLSPGWVLTERQKRLWANDRDLKNCLDQQSLKQPLNGWDMAGPALFLASSMSSQMTGQEILVDGGRAYT